jgi:hypothetical protein
MNEIEHIQKGADIEAALQRACIPYTKHDFSITVPEWNVRIDYYLSEVVIVGADATKVLTGLIDSDRIARRNIIRGLQRFEQIDRCRRCTLCALGSAVVVLAAIVSVLRLWFQL